MEIYHTLRPTGINTRDTWYSGSPYTGANCYKNVNEATKSETDYNLNLDTVGFNQTQSVLHFMSNLKSVSNINLIFPNIIS